MTRTVRLLPALALVTVLLTSCVPETPAVTPPPEPTAEPVFASDEEALAAAEEAYRRYIATVDAILADGGMQPERLKAHVAQEIYAQEAVGYEQLSANRWHGTGTTSFTLSLQWYDHASLTTYVCEDISKTDIVDDAEISVVNPGRQTLLPYEVTFDALNSMQITQKTRWEGGGVC